MAKRIINISDVDPQPLPEQFSPKGLAAERYGFKMGQISTVIGANKLGYNLTAVPPGKRAFPFHNHHVNEEMFFIIEGAGEVRMGDATYPIRTGDIIACPAGGKESAHQIINTGTVELRYLAVSTRTYPEICDYPDSGKFGILATVPAGEDGKPREFRFVGRESLNVGYWEGE